MKNCTPLWSEAHFQVKMYKTPQLRGTFRSCDVEKVHAVVARSTFRSQNVQSTPAPDHFWKLRCRKSARRCGAKHIWMSKVEKSVGYGALLDVQMCFRVAGAMHLVKSEQHVRVLCSTSKNDGRHGPFDEDLQRWISRGRRSTRDIFIRAVRRSGR